MERKYEKQINLFIPIFDFCEFTIFSKFYNLYRFLYFQIKLNITDHPIIIDQSRTLRHQDIAKTFREEIPTGGKTIKT